MWWKLECLLLIFQIEFEIIRSGSDIFQSRSRACGRFFFLSKSLIETRDVFFPSILLSDSIFSTKYVPICRRCINRNQQITFPMIIFVLCRNFSKWLKKSARAHTHEANSSSSINYVKSSWNQYTRQINSHEYRMDDKKRTPTHLNQREREIH